jgi:hypothetical protein
VIITYQINPTGHYVLFAGVKLSKISREITSNTLSLGGQACLLTDTENILPLWCRIQLWVGLVDLSDRYSLSKDKIIVAIGQPPKVLQTFVSEAQWSVDLQIG